MVLGTAVLLALAWFLSMEGLRGRPATTPRVSAILKFVNPVGVLLILVAAWLLR